MGEKEGEAEGHQKHIRVHTERAISLPAPTSV